MRVVLDSNVVLSGFFFGGIPGIVLKGWRTGRFRMVISPPVLSEYREAGAALESRYGGSEFGTFATLLALKRGCPRRAGTAGRACLHRPGRRQVSDAPSPVERPWLVSGDRALLDVSGWRGVEVIRPRALVDQYLPDLK